MCGICLPLDGPARLVQDCYPVDTVKKNWKVLAPTVLTRTLRNCTAIWMSWEHAIRRRYDGIVLSGVHTENEKLVVRPCSRSI